MLIAVILLCPSTHLSAKSNDWIFDPATSMRTLWDWAASELEGSRYLGSSALSWPDGRQAIVYHFKVGSRLWRCIDYFDADMKVTGKACYKFGLLD